MNTYTTVGPAPKIYTDDVMRMRDILHEGDTVLAEVFTPRETSGGAPGVEEVMRVTILEKYPHVARTDRGTVSWVNITIHNQHLLRR